MSPASARWQSEAALADFVAAFESGTLPKPEWTHAAHLAIGACHVLAHGEAEALRLLRQRIRRLNECHGVANTDSGGYHESITRFWLALVAHVLREHRALHPEATQPDLIAAAVNAFRHRRDLYRVYWSFDVAASAPARRGWIEPDALPLGVLVALWDDPARLRALAPLLDAYARSLPLTAAAGSLYADRRSALLGYLPPQGAFFVARLAGASIGCVALRWLAPGVGEIKRLYVRPGHRRQGIARALVDAAIAYARQQGARTLRLGTLNGMSAARALYERLGFREIPPYPDSDPVDETWYERTFAGPA